MTGRGERRKTLDKLKLWSVRNNLIGRNSDDNIVEVEAGGGG